MHLNKGGVLRKIFVIVVVGVLSLFFSKTLLAAEDPHVVYTKGILAFSDNDFEKALQNFKIAYKTNPGHQDNLYFLGMTHLRLENFAEASRYFKELLDKNPNYAKVYFDYGMSFFRQAKYQEALIWFEKGKKADPKDFRNSFYEALSNYHLGKGPMPKEAASGAKITKTRRWNASASSGFFYDTNVSVDPDNEDIDGFPAHPRDVLVTGSLDMQFLLNPKQQTKFYLEGSGYQSGHTNTFFDSGHFNYSRLRGGMKLQRRSQDNVQWTMPIYYTFAGLGTSRYLQSQNWALIFDVPWDKRWVSTFGMYFQRDDFYHRPANLSQDRDAMKPSFRAEQYLFFPNNKRLYFKSGYEIGYNFAAGADWDYIFHRFTFSSQLPLLWGINFATHCTFDADRMYYKTDSVFGLRRRDFLAQVTGLLTKDFAKHYSATLMYSYTKQDSTIERYTNTKQLGGFVLAVRL